MNKEDFAPIIQQLYSAHKRMFHSEQSLQYFERFKRLTPEQMQELVTAAIDEIAKFPSIAELVKIARNKGLFEQKVSYSGRSPFVLFICHCGSSTALERKKIEGGTGSFMCPNVKYRKPISWHGRMAKAEHVWTQAFIKAQTLPAQERDNMREKASQDYKAEKALIEREIVDAPLMCDRSWDYSFIKAKCKTDKYGCIDMKTQKIKEDDPFLFEVQTGK
jgi:hypothetical protein